MKKLIVPLLFATVGILNTPARAQSQKSTYDHHAAFAPTFFADGGNLFRSADGTPGKRYWQNEADYTVSATLDTATKRLSGNVQITYTNNSPNNLIQLWLQLVHNARRSDSRASAVYGRYRKNASDSAGFNLHRVQIKKAGKWQKVDYRVDGTRMHIILPDTLKRDGASVQARITYDYKLPEHARGGYMPSKNGEIYTVSYWYPRMCVYDDLRGWNVLPFLGAGEFYLDYGTIDYKVTVPEGMLVVGSGKLQNPGETLTEKERQQLKKAHQSDTTVLIRSQDDLSQPATQKGKNGMLTWHFHMEHTRDVAWAASKAFIWDGAEAKFDNGQSSLAMSVYPVESAGRDAWSRATEYLQRSIEIFSNHWMTYPYANAINVAGPTGGMEYPGLTFDSYKAKTYLMFLLASHEIGHNWFPMMVGSNERRNAWMDEGFNTFIDVYVHKAFNNGEYAPKRDAEYGGSRNPNGTPADSVVSVITGKDAQPIMTKADGFKGKNLHPTEYFKAAFGLVMLREIVLGPKRFDYAFRHYMHDWKWKHPGAKDFFRAMNNYAGEDLNWFWRGWFLHNWKLDQAVTDVKNGDDGPVIILRNLDKMPMPVLMTVKTSGGSTTHYKLPVEVWENGGTYMFHPNVKGKITGVQLDANHRLPDVNRSNNSWSGGQQ